MSDPTTGTARVARVVLSGLLTSLTGLAFGPIFGGLPGPRSFIVAIIATAGTSTFVMIVAALARRLSPTIVTLGGALAVVGVAAAVTKTGGAMTSGPWQLLTAALPVDAAGPPLAAVSVAVGWSALMSGLLAAYANSPLAPAFPAVACLLGGLSLGAAGPSPPGWLAPAAVALMVGLLAVGRQARPSLGTVVAVVVTGAVAVLATLVLGPAMPGARANEPADARSLVAPPVLPKSGVSPLQKYLAWRDGSPPLRVSGTTTRPGSRLKLATLNRFDGSFWTVGADYRLAGRRLPEPRDRGRTIPVTQRVNIEAGDPEWLLCAGRATRSSVDGMGVDESTGDVVVPAGKPSPAAYQISSDVNRVTLKDVGAAEPKPLRAALTPALPPAVRGFLERTVAGQTATTDRLTALQRRFIGQGDFRYDQAQVVAGGHGYYQIQRLLETKRGTSEQYASAFAVMARHLGADAHVVMGFRPEYQGNSFLVTGRNVDAWVEVGFAGLGWISIDPSPRNNPIGTRPDAPRAPEQGAQADDPPNSAAPQPPERSRSPSNDANPPATAPVSGSGRTSTMGSIVAASLLALILTPPAAKTLRRIRRRRHRSPRRAALGAWWETLDRLREAGVPVRPTLTTGEVAVLASDLHEIRGLARLVDGAAYAPETPPTELPQRAWTAATAVHRKLRTRMSRTRRIRAFLDPRPLFPSR